MARASATVCTDTLMPVPCRGDGPSISGPHAKIRGRATPGARLSSRSSRMELSPLPTSRTVVTPWRRNSASIQPG